jgi:hypothetical protein
MKDRKIGLNVGDTRCRSSGLCTKLREMTPLIEKLRIYLNIVSLINSKTRFTASKKEND